MNRRINGQSNPNRNISVLLEQMGLTPREVEIVEWVSRGKTNKEIGLILEISPRTTSKHLEHIFLKLGVTSRVDAVVRFLQMLQTNLHVPDTYSVSTGNPVSMERPGNPQHTGNQDKDKNNSR